MILLIFDSFFAGFFESPNVLITRNAYFMEENELFLNWNKHRLLAYTLILKLLF